MQKGLAITYNINAYMYAIIYHAFSDHVFTVLKRNALWKATPKNHHVPPIIIIIIQLKLKSYAMYKNV